MSAPLLRLTDMKTLTRSPRHSLSKIINAEALGLERGMIYNMSCLTTVTQTNGFLFFHILVLYKI